MRHLFGGVAIAALLAAGLPAAAQTSSTDQNAPAATSGQTAPGASSSGTTDQSGATTQEKTTTGKMKKKKAMTGEHAAKSKGAKGKQAMAHKRSPEDNMAEELNRQELQKVGGGGAQAPSSGTSAPGGTMQGQPGSGQMAPKQ